MYVIECTQNESDIGLTWAYFKWISFLEEFSFVRTAIL